MLDLARDLPFAQTIGLELEHADAQEVRGKLQISKPLCTAAAVGHGGALMSLADSLAAIGAYLNLKPGESTATILSQTHFLGAAKLGSTVHAHSTAVSVKRRLSVWQTRIVDEDQRLLALVTQTQLTTQA